MKQVITIILITMLSLAEGNAREPGMLAWVEKQVSREERKGAKDAKFSFFFAPSAVHCALCVKHTPYPY
jgi:hypothetical protein